MKDEDTTLTGWPAVSMFLVLGITAALTSLVMSFPIAWLVNHVFATGTIHAIFGVERLGYWRTVGLFAIWHAARARIKIRGPRKSIVFAFGRQLIGDLRDLPPDQGVPRT